MFRYLQEAFFARVRMGWLGAVPVNGIAFTGLMILGFGHPGFWFVGVGLELVYLWAVSGNVRFQKWVAAKSIGEVKDRETVQWKALLARMNAEHQGQARHLAERCNQVRETYRLNQTDESIIDNNLSALGRLQAIHARLLLARQQIEERENTNDEPTVVQEIARLEEELQQTGLPESLVRSKRATLEILQKRLRAVRARSVTSEEIDSDLKRIEAQVELALDHATMQTKPPAISLDLELTSQFIDTGPIEPEPPARIRPIAQ
jgi:hypothetical protein